MTTLKQPLYQQLMHTIRGPIRDGVLKPGEMAPSESDLIAEFRVSSTTARRCLNELATAGLVHRVQGKGTFVAPLATDAACRHLGVLFHDLIDLTDTFSSEALRGCAAIADHGDQAYEPLLLNLRRVRSSSDHAAALAAMARQHNLDAMLLMSPVPPAWLPETPTAAINFSYDDPRIISVTCDHDAAFDRLAARLVNMNHRRVVMMRGRFEQQLVDHVQLTRMPTDRLPQGWINEEHTYFQQGDIQRIVSRHLASTDRPTAFFCFGYDVAMAVAAEARRRGCTIPDDLSVVFIGVPAPHTHFTGETVPIEAMTTAAVTQLICRIEGQPEPSTQRFASITHNGGTLGPART